MKEYLYDSYQLYFNALSKLGYKNYLSVLKLIVLSIIEELMDFLFLTRDDWETLSKAVECLVGTDCMLPEYKVPCKLEIPINTEDFRYLLLYTGIESPYGKGNKWDALSLLYKYPILYRGVTLTGDYSYDELYLYYEDNTIKTVNTSELFYIKNMTPYTKDLYYGEVLKGYLKPNTLTTVEFKNSTMNIIETFDYDTIHRTKDN